MKNQYNLVNKLRGKFIKYVKLVPNPNPNPNLCKKEKYVVHYRNLKLYKSLGINITKIHRAIMFKQTAWMAPYIQFNTH